MRVRFAVPSLVAVVALLAAAPAASADDKGTFELTAATSTATWSGSSTAGAFPTDPPSAACASSPLCDVLKLDVNLPAGTWDGRPGGMSVAIQWPYIDAGYDLDLRIYAPDGSLAAASDTLIFSRNESLWVPNPGNGAYTVQVTPRTVWGVPRELADRLGEPKLGPLDYEGFVELERGLTITREETLAGLPYTRTIIAHDRTSAQPVQELLPDLVSTTPSNWHLETGQGVHFYFFMDRGLRHQPSCYPQETLGLNEDTPTVRLGGPTRCLRWDQGEYNLGKGPLELHNYSNVGDGTDLWQRIYSTDGSVAQAKAGQVRFSSTHGHFHAQGFQEIGLYERNPDGSLGRLVARPPNKGICMVDIENSYFGRTDKGGNPLQMDLPGTCDASLHQDPNDPTYPNELYLQMGITVGYADVYPWFVADQYIDTTNVPDGRYIVRATVNGSRRIRESDYDNNSAQACVEIAGMTARDC